MSSSTSRVAGRRTVDDSHIGKYKLLKTIGKGNFAKVSAYLLYKMIKLNFLGEIGKTYTNGSRSCDQDY